MPEISRCERRAEVMNDHVGEVVAQRFELLQPFVVLVKLLEKVRLPIVGSLFPETGTDTRLQQCRVEPAWSR